MFRGKKKSILPSTKLLDVTFHGKSLEQVSTTACFDLLFITKYHSHTLQCPRCELVSRFRLTNKGKVYRPIYECEYEFCRYELPLDLTHIIPPSGLIPLASWLYMLYMLRTDPHVKTEQLRVALGISYPGAKDMRVKLSKLR